MKKRYAVPIVIWLIVLCSCYYVILPPLNIHSPEFWTFFMVFILVPLFILSMIKSFSDGGTWKERLQGLRSSKNKGKLFTKVVLVAFAICLVALFGGTLFGAPIFHAKGYASILSMKEYDFTEDIDESKVLNKVALMDTASARILGNRKIGSLSNVVSQFDVAYDYTQIDYKGGPLKVAPLEYTGFFKYLANKKDGVPGYVTVDPVGQSTKYVTCDGGMKYVPSAYFQKDLLRHLRFAYPTSIFENIHFEVDEDGNPYYVASVMAYKISLFNGETVKGVVILDPITGETRYYKVKDIPTWVDKAYDGDLLVRQFDWYGTYNNGYINSLFAKKGCRKSTETHRSGSDDGDDGVADYGYISKEGDIWIYTGVTSVNEDASNIGFIMVNERTGEAHYFTIPGADENSAMNAAEGEVQEKAYKASFPSLINVQGNATYIMLLKDANDIVKMYAMVNVEQYNLVTTGETLTECYDSYCKLLGLSTKNDEQGDKKQAEGEKKEVTFVIDKIQTVVIEGDTYIYFTDKENHIYKQRFADNEELILLEKGTKVKANCTVDKNGVATINEISETE
ncbi:MAG: hypothetical protein K6A30_03975 [Lachnospiraceae bacterium]|nr:hypothetical protein [Lachnospiraceae bacterium]